jgi:hypothetical protein
MKTYIVYIGPYNVGETSIYISQYDAKFGHSRIAEKYNRIVMTHGRYKYLNSLYKALSKCYTVKITTSGRGTEDMRIRI